MHNICKKKIVGEQSYRDFLKCLELVVQGVLTPDDFAAMMSDKMISGTRHKF